MTKSDAALLTFCGGLALLASVSPEVRKAGKALGLPALFVAGSIAAAINADKLKSPLR